MKPEVVVTGIGIVSSIGQDLHTFENNLFSGTSGVRSLYEANIVAADFPVPYAAWIDKATLGSSKLYSDSNKIPKSWLMSEEVTRQALATLAPEFKIDAILYGTADGVSYEIVESILLEGQARDYDPVKLCSEAPLYAIRDTVEQLAFSKIPSHQLISLNSACASGNQTIGIAMEGIRSGRWTRCLAGGVDARCEPSNFLNFHFLGALTTDDVPPAKASRPFSKDRSGFVRGEGAAVLLLETREAAETRGAKILGVIAGYGCTSDAYRLTDGREDAASVMEAMRLAVKSADLELNQIDYINAHGTATPLNDRLETFAIKELFGNSAYQIPVSSLKSQIGHATIASSAIEAVASLLMLKRQMISPTINYDIPDPECDLDYVPNVARSAKVTNVLSNSFGFGGQNTCLVIQGNSHDS